MSKIGRRAPCARATATNPAELMRFQESGAGAAAGGPFDGDRAPPMMPGRALPSGDDELAESFRFAEQAGRGGLEQGEATYDDREGAARQQVIEYERSKEAHGRQTRARRRDPAATPPQVMRFQEAQDRRPG